jgi:uncharacterized protein involved in exopolysaccharide biosynthesis
MTQQQTFSTPNPQCSGEGQNQNLSREFSFIIFERFKLVRTVFLSVFILALVLAIALPSVYRATAKFSLTVPQSIDPLQQENSYDYRNRVTRFLRDQKELILSNRVLEKVAKDFFPDAAKNPSKTIEKMRQRLVVTPPKGETYEGSSIFYVSYEDSDPQRSADITNTIVQTYLTTYGEVGKERSDYSYNFFKAQMEKLKEDMGVKEKELREYETKQAVALIEILNLGSETNSKEVGPNALLTQVTGKYHELQEQLAGLKTSINAMEKELQDNKIPVILPDMEVPGRSISVLKNKVAQLQIELNEMRPRFTEASEFYQQVEKTLDLNIASLRDELKRTAQAKEITAQTIQAQMQELELIIKELREHIQSTANEKSLYQHLKQEYTIVRDDYIHARNQLEQARLSQSLHQEKQYITLVDKPIPPSKPYSPNRLLIIALGLFAGLFLGVAAALTIDYFDHTIKKPLDIECYLGAPFLGSLPRVVQDTTGR